MSGQRPQVASTTPSPGQTVTATGGDTLAETGFDLGQHIDRRFISGALEKTGVKKSKAAELLQYELSVVSLLHEEVRS